MASATAGHVWNSQTVATATSTNILPSTEPGVMEVLLSCDSGSAVGLRINVQNKVPQNTTHPPYLAADATTYFVLAPGQSITFFSSSRGNPITAIYVDGNGGTATFSGTVTGV